MTNYRRFKVAGGTYFFTVNLQVRGGSLLVDRIDDLREAYRNVQSEMPFRTEAITVMPDHLHTVWTLPGGDADYSTRWKRIKREFTVSVGRPQPRSRSKAEKGEAGIWQRRFWEHFVRDEADYQACLTYTLANPVKHGLVSRAVDWPYSSIHRDIREGKIALSGV